MADVEPFGFHQCLGDGKMKKPLSILACTLVIGFGALSTHTAAQAKTAKACAEEWRADKAGFQAKGITEKAYVADCRAGTSSAPAVAPAPTAAAPTPMSPPPAATNTGQKTAKACVEEWRADKAGFQAKGITEKAYVADCRAGTTPTPAAVPAPTAAAPAPSPMAPTPAAAGQKTAKACTEEWRADKAGFQAKGITEKAYVAACRAGTVATPATAPAPAPTTAAPAPAPAPTGAAPAPAPSASRPSAQPPYGTTERGPSTGSPSGAGQFANEAQAKATCPGDTVVWANLRSKIYHFAGTHNYGNTKDGAYMCERDTAAQGMRAAKNEQHP
jgi:hypothetical protein